MMDDDDDIEPVTRIARLETEIARMQSALDAASEREIGVGQELKRTYAALDAVREQLKMATELVRVATCPNDGCGGQGWFARQFAAGEWEQEQCQWCYEKHLLIAPLPEQPQ